MVSSRQGLEAILCTLPIWVSQRGSPRPLLQAPIEERGQEAVLLTHSDLCQALLWELYTHHLVSLSCHPWVGRIVPSNICR